MHLEVARSLSRRSAFRLAAATLAVCEFSGLPAAQAESNFTVGSSGGTWGDGIKQAFIGNPGFADKFSVRPSSLDGAVGVLIARLLAQPGNPPFTVADLLDTEHFLAADSGAIQDYDLDLVTNYQDIYPSARHPARAGLSHWCASMTLPLISITYNTKHATAPTSWKDLWLDKYVGKVAVPDMSWFGLTWLHAINKEFGGDESNVSPGIAAAGELMRKNKALLIKTQEAAIKAYTDEDVVIMPYWNGRTFSLQESGVPVAMAYVPGTIQLHNGFVIAKNTRYKDLANQFVNNTLDGSLQLQMSRLFKYPPASRTVKLPPDIEHYAPPPQALEKIVVLDWAKINAGRAATIERWNREVLG